MELSRAYREIEDRLQKIDFPSLYRGFSRYPFALYNETEAYDTTAIAQKARSAYRPKYLNSLSFTACSTSAAVCLAMAMLIPAVFATEGMSQTDGFRLHPASLEFHCRQDSDQNINCVQG